MTCAGHGVSLHIDGASWVPCGVILGVGTVDQMDCLKNLLILEV